MPGFSASSPAEEARARLLVARATYGPRPGYVDEVLRKGTARWLDEQLHPERIDDSALDRRLAGFHHLSLRTGELMRKFPKPSRAEREAMAEAREAVEGATDPRDRRRAMADLRKLHRKGQARVLVELSQAKLLRAVYSRRQLYEVMADFWFNHFNVYARKNRNTLLSLPEYEREAIRPHALGKFHDLLSATARSPAMLFYLDNWINMKDGFDPRALVPGRRRGRRDAERRRFGINENYARELLELHTLGVDGGYTQNDVVEVARAFTGWSVVGPQAIRVRERIGRRFGEEKIPKALRSLPEEGSFFFNALAHDDEPKTVLGRRIDEGGIEDGTRVLERLSEHGSTARFLSRKLAERFVSDEPSEAIVEEMAETFGRSGGDIRVVLRTLLLSDSFLEEAGASPKLKTPLELVTSSVRTTDGEVRGPGLVRAVEALGMPLYLCQPPTGYDDGAAAWLSAGNMLTRMRFAHELVEGRVPGVDPPRVPGDWNAWIREVFGRKVSSLEETEGAPGQRSRLLLALAGPGFQWRGGRS